MAGHFELVDAPDGGYRVRMLDGSGNLIAISVTFPTKRAAVAGIGMAREIAGTGLIRDYSSNRAGAIIRDRTGPVSSPKDNAAARGKKVSGAARAVAG
ncbi:YegP family protein [Pseudarthrobacter sp. Y6]|uniref:YegP family protein n=1 Tax=Pseudarthrobacter sp. Y6 TaxID=3418422 RepID=UPI003CED5723